MTILLILVAVALIVGGLITLGVARGQAALQTRRAASAPPHAGLVAWKYLVIGGLVVLFAAVVTTFVVVVPAGYVGVVTNFGRVEERTLPAGLQIVTPIAQQVVVVDVRVQPHPFEEIDAASKEYQAVKLTGNMNYHIDPLQAYDLYRTVGLDFAEKVIDPAFNDFIKEVVPRYAVTEILPKREEIRRLAQQELGANLARYHIIVDDIYLSNIRFSPEYEAAIERKQVAEQQVQTERQILEQRRVQAQQRVAEAQGAADAAIVTAKGEAQAATERATGEAEANRRVAASLSDQILAYRYIQELTERLQVAVVPGGQGFLFDLKSLLGQGTPQGSPSPAPSPVPTALPTPTPAP